MSLRSGPVQLYGLIRQCCIKLLLVLGPQPPFSWPLSYLDTFRGCVNR